MEWKLSKRIDRLIPSGIRKVNERALEMERNGETVLHFEIGRPDFVTPDYIVRACIESLEAGDVFYTSNFGYAELRKEVAAYLNRHCRVPYAEEEILITVGLAEAVFDVLTILLEDGDEVLVPDPGWINYSNVTKLLGAEPVNYSLLEEREYQPDLSEIREKITERTKAIILITPNNPTGSVISRENLEGIAKLAVEKNLIVISDEIYERLLYNGETHISIAAFPEMKERTVTLNGFSKAYSMTGWRIGYAAAPKEVISALNKVHQHNTTSAASFVQKAAITALRNEGNEVREMVKEYQRRRDYVVAAIENTDGISCVCPKGAFYIFINIKALGFSSGEVSQYLLEEEKIALVPGDVFGKNGEGYLRMSFANSYENLEEGCRRLAEGIQQMKKLHSGSLKSRL